MPASIDLDLGSIQTVAQIQLVVMQSPAGATEHHVYGGLSKTFTGNDQLAVISQTTHDNDVLTLTGPFPNVRYLRIYTAASPSWIAWREINVYKQGEMPPPPPPPPAPPPAAPSGLAVLYTTKSTFHVVFSDNSTNETQWIITNNMGRFVTSFTSTTTTTTSNTAGAVYLDIAGFAPGSNMCFFVTASNAGGSSAPSNTVCATTQPPSNTGTTASQLATFALGVANGQTFYTGTFPPAGTSSAHVLSITNPNNYIVGVVKQGHSVADCNTPGATVLLAAGQTTMPTELQQVFGSQSPALPITPIFCGANIPPTSSLSMTITFQ